MSDAGFRYPPPAGALTVWFNGSALCIAVPPSAPGARGHTVMLPLEKLSIECGEGGTPLARQLGWRVLLDLLQAAYRRESAGPARIAEPSAPSLWQIEQALKSSGGASGPRLSRLGSGPAGRTTLSDLDLDD